MKIRSILLPLAIVAGFGGGALAQGLDNGGGANQPPPGQSEISNGPTGVAPAGAGGVAAGGSAQLFAVVNADGTLARGKGAFSAEMYVTGQYAIRFARDITACVYTATIGNGGDGSQPPGFLTLARRGGTANGVYVATYDMTGVYAERAFHLWVNC